MLDDGQLVDGIEVLAGALLRLSTGQEGDSGNSRGDSPGESSNGVEGNLLRGGLLFTSGTLSDHVGFQQKTLEEESLGDELIHDSVEDLLGNLSTFSNIMITIRNNLWLNDWHETIVLANLTISGERVGSLGDGNLRWAIFIDLNDSSPFGEPGTHLVVSSGSLGKSIETLGLSFIISTLNKDHAGINLNSCKDALVGEHRERPRGLGARQLGTKVCRGPKQRACGA